MNQSSGKICAAPQFLNCHVITTPQGHVPKITLSYCQPHWLSWLNHDAICHVSKLGILPGTLHHELWPELT